MGTVVYGHWGPPLLGFPTSAGDEWELEGQGLVESLSPLIDAGRVKFFSINSVNSAGFYNKSAHPFHRSWVQSQFDAYVRYEVVPFIQDNCQSRDIAISTMGASFGAYHAANTLFKHPDVVRRCFALSGVYDIKNFMNGMYDDNTYFNNPVDYLSNLSDGNLMAQLSQCDIHIATGSGPWENSGPSTGSRQFCRRREFPIIWTIGGRKAGTTGRIGNIRCGSTSPGCFSPLGQPEAVEQIAALTNHLLFVDPDIASARQHVHMRSRTPRCMRLAAVRIAESKMHARQFLILQQHTNHVGQAEVRAEGQFANAVAVLIRVAIFPEFLFQILARAFR